MLLGAILIGCENESWKRGRDYPRMEVGDEVRRFREICGFGNTASLRFRYLSVSVYLLRGRIESNELVLHG